MIPIITVTQTGNPYTYFITIQAGQSYLVNTISLVGNYLTVGGNLSSVNAVTLSPNGEIGIVPRRVEIRSAGVAV